MRNSLNSPLNTWVAIVAGTGCPGYAANMLYGPNGIFVTTNLGLYVADSYNSRVQLFQSGQLNAITVAGYGASGTVSLDTPTGVVLDGDGYLFIVDQGYGRIVGSGPNGFRCVVGCNGSGLGSNQLYNPFTLSFDSDGNMFVSDRYNGRIQKFLLTSNSFGK